MAFYNELITEIKGFLKRNSGIPSGFIMSFGGKTVPSGWLPCDGSAVSRTQYADLFAAIGTSWGDGDGSTTFNVPDLRDRVIQGAKTFNEVGTYLEAQLPNITGTFSAQQLTTGAETANATASGALFVAESRSTEGSTGTYSACCAIGLDASKGDATYSGSKVQAQAGLVLLCIKI